MRRGEPGCPRQLCPPCSRKKWGFQHSNLAALALRLCGSVAILVNDQLTECSTAVVNSETHSSGPAISNRESGRVVADVFIGVLRYRFNSSRDPSIAIVLIVKMDLSIEEKYSILMGVLNVCQLILHGSI